MSEMPVDSRRQTPRFREKREAILEAAARLFNRRGVSGTTLSDVAESVGLVTNSVTYYYRKKEDLATACLLRAIAAFDELLSHAEQAPDAESRVRAFVSGYFGLLADIESGNRADIVNFTEISSLSHSLAVAASGYDGIFRRVRHLLSSDASDFSRAELTARAHLLFTLTQWSRVWVHRYEVSGYRRAGQQVCDILLRGLGADNAVWKPSAMPTIKVEHAGEAVKLEAFLRAATRLINAKGARGTSISEVSAALNLTKGSFYHHNDNKDDLIVACFERTFEVIRRAQSDSAAAPTGWIQLCESATSLVRYQLSDAGPLLRITARSGLAESSADRILRTMNRLSEEFANFIVDGIADGSVRPVDPTIASQMVHGMINASASIKRWVPTVAMESVTDLYARPLFTGLLQGGESKKSG